MHIPGEIETKKLVGINNSNKVISGITDARVFEEVIIT
ncbi:hypothetical protein PTD2_14497 [Pseudoalteromonas tunicata D2]|uniref:Uncharacterized protein n=1 Tax=Pseudoalteromonas tunicata D2 TaxID=87626 RepID=A4CCG4_9GAMM|nr:hypothetical protein PTD2_14497 [Pseudoalteromonas tunicata D2]